MGPSPRILRGADPDARVRGRQGRLAGRIRQEPIAVHEPANGKLDEDAAQRLNQGCFDIYLADPRDAKPGEARAPPCRGHPRDASPSTSSVRRPAQPFP